MHEVKLCKAWYKHTVAENQNKDSSEAASLRHKQGYILSLTMKCNV